MEDFLIMLTIPVILFTLIVAPIWLTLHYRSKKQINQGLSEEELALLRELVKRADKLAERIDVLERVLEPDPLSGGKEGGL